MIYQEREATSELEGIVSRLWVLETTPLRRFEKILPLPSVHLIVNLSTPYRLFDRRGEATLVSDAFVSGVQSEYLVIESPPTIHHVGAELLPASAADDHGRRSRPARRARAGRAGGVDRRGRSRRRAPRRPVGRMTRSMSSPCSSSRSAPPALPTPSSIQPIAAIQADPGQTIGDLAALAGVSHRTLIARFRAATGHRSEGVRAALAVPHVRHRPPLDRSRAPDWAGLAAASGFYDQPHVIRAFRRFTGWTPAEYYRRVVEFGPEAASFVPLEELPIVED